MRGVLLLVIFVGLLAPVATIATPQAGQVTICHIPPGNPNAARTITVGAAALEAHLNHGDLPFPCPTEVGPSDRSIVVLSLLLAGWVAILLYRRKRGYQS
ncbi:MAG TPA: hypothetical protein VK747_22660 [Blastocatellia bacterium]|jgi:hypothetical protein|nr:hypothetical protein [Blastocatellia bacterium]